MNDLIKVRQSLEGVLDAEQLKSYYDLLKKWMAYASPLTKLQFNTKVREILKTPEQLQKHNQFLYAFLCKSYIINTEETKILGGGSGVSSSNSNSTSSKGTFQVADCLKYSASNPVSVPNDMEHRSAAAELFVPDYNFLSNKIAVYAWENGLEGADESVTEIMMHACQTFIQNIITAMVTRKMGYKIRNGNFQHSFGQPVPDPFLRNTNFIRDSSQECKAEVSQDDDSFAPAYRPTIETTEAQAIFAHACANKRFKSSDKTLDMKLLYHTLREDPSIVGLNSIHSLHMLKTSFALEEM